MKIDSNATYCSTKVDFSGDTCADGICCFMSIPRKQTHLGMWKYFLKRGNATAGIKLFYTTLQEKDIVYNPCKCLDFYLKECKTPDGYAFQVLLRCGIFGKRCRPYTCKEFPDKTDSFMHDILAPCVYNEYIAPENYIALKHKHIFQLFYAIKDDHKLLGKIFPGYTVEETRRKLNRCKEIVKISAIWNEKPAEYFLLEVPKSNAVLYTSVAHPKIKGVQQAYSHWQGHIESWLERHYGSKWQDYLDRTIEEEADGMAKK
ncbi:MAG: hypothetical protein HUU08_01400 [Candidatus Brocadia sp.]|nr:hypothetical protein [Candidatus Brocadia sp.]